MNEFRVLDETYEIAPDFSLKAYFGDAWEMIPGHPMHHVAIHFSPKVAGNIEEVGRHRTQQTHRLPNGSLLFEVDVDGIEEVSWWVLGYGEEAIVQEPPELRGLLAERARALVAEYANEHSPVTKPPDSEPARLPLRGGKSVKGIGPVGGEQYAAARPNPRPAGENPPDGEPT